MSGADGGAGHGRIDCVADMSLQVALGRHRQIVVADCGRSFGGEKARGAARVSPRSNGMLALTGGSPHVRGETIVQLGENTCSVYS